MKYASLFEEHIRVQQRAVQTHKILLATLFAIGTTAILFALFGKIGDLSSKLELAKLGLGIVMEGLSVAQLKEIITRRERIATFTYLKKSFEEELSPEQEQSFVQLAMETIKETMHR